MNYSTAQNLWTKCSGHTATIFGATGFLGRYVVQQLASSGFQIVVPYRGTEDACRHLKTMGHLGQVVPVKYAVRDDRSMQAAMATSNVLINLIGRDYESHNFSFEEVNVTIPDRISGLARDHGSIRRYIHVSALGASSENPAPQYRTKAAGEEITFENFPTATILRPAHMFGKEDRLLNKWAGFAKSMPVVPIIGDGSNKFQPAHVADVAAAVVAIVQSNDSSSSSSTGKTFELGGPAVYTVNELVFKQFTPGFGSIGSIATQNGDVWVIRDSLHGGVKATHSGLCSVNGEPFTIMPYSQVSLVYDTIAEEPRTLHIPFSVAKLVVDEDLFKSIPFPTPKLITFSRNNIKSLRAHYVVSRNALTFEDLGIQPRRLEGTAIEYLYQYRRNASTMGGTAGEEWIGTNP